MDSSKLDFMRVCIPKGLTFATFSSSEIKQVLLPNSAKKILIAQLALLKEGFISEANELENKFCQLFSSTKDQYYDCNYPELEDYVNEIIASNEGSVQECRGEGDYRNIYIKNALSRVFKGKICPFCKKGLKHINVIRNKILIPDLKLKVAEKFSGNKRKSLDGNTGNYIQLVPTESKKYLENIWYGDQEFMKSMIPLIAYSSEPSPVDALYMTVIPVSPTNCRPVNYVNGVITEHPQNTVYKSILNDCLVLRSIIHIINNDGLDTLTDERKEVVEGIRGKTYEEKLQFAWQELQLNVDSLLDIDAKKQRRAQGIGIKQIIEKKEGIIRMNMMGKRVNYAARTVITPDPNLNIDEVGIPETFAKKLTYPVPVTVWNVSDLRNLVKNGPNEYPGANFVENEDGSIVKLDGNSKSQRSAVAKRLLTPGDCKGIKTVHRHLINGDILLLNRQPTLHKPSIMAHRARILRGEKTFRLHYANCKSYNADFDGDEMNAHFPQNEVARSEGYNIVSVSKQYLVPKDGTPLSGLIQDHVISGVRLSMRGKFFTRTEYMHLAFQGLNFMQGDIETLPPALIKPCKMWSGKQVISTVVKNIIPKGQAAVNLTSVSKISVKAWEKVSSPRKWKAGGTPFTNSNTMTEAEVVFRNGELLCGVLDKTHYGATPYSLVHCVYELYGGDIATKLLSAFAKLFTAFLQMEGFTLGVEDILVVKNADKVRHNIIEEIKVIGDNIAKEVVEPLPDEDIRDAVGKAHKKDPMFRALLDHQYKKSLDSFTNNINKVCLPAGLLTPFPKNNLQLMVQSGAKGSTVNTMQISCLLGQIELEGRRPPLMLSGRSLPSFPPYDTSPRAGGFIYGRFMTGIQPQEFFFHCMAGREGLIDTAVKTSRSGYLQRCLVKHLEGLTVNYDQTVRDSDGTVVQFLYGEDGMEVTKCQFLKEEQLPFLVDNINSIYNPEEIESLKEGTDLESVKAHSKLIKKWNRHRIIGQKQWCSPFSLFSLQVDGSGTYKKTSSETGRTASTQLACKLWRDMNETERNKFHKVLRRAPDPVTSKFQSDRNFGSITEKLDLMIDHYLKRNKHQVNEKQVKSALYQKAMASLCPPGEPVGLLAAQSVGEPSTQMTLNTFHFAGRGEMNVTLGIPRLREILMTASKNIKTPSVTVPFSEDIASSEKKMNRLRKRFTKLTMADVLQIVTVTEKVEVTNPRRQVFVLKLEFLPHAAYKDNTFITPKDILKHVEKKFIKELVHYMTAKTSKITELIDSENENKQNDGMKDDEDDEKEGEVKSGSNKKRFGAVGDDYQSSDEEPENEDDDATTVKRRARQNEEQQYSDLEDDVEALEDLGAERKIKVEKEDEDEKEENAIKEDPDEPVAGPSSMGERKSSVIESHPEVIDYRYDTERHRWCEIVIAFSLNLGHVDMAGKLKHIAAVSVIHQIPGIKRAFITNEIDNSKCLKTDGQNLSELYSHCRKLNLNKLYTNDINAVQNMYGIEAAAKLIVKEIQQVFKVYGITVDIRHLNLIADYMTWSGEYRALNRRGLEGSCSPLQQMSFESSTGFLRSAVTRHKFDSLTSPSSRLIVGRPIKAGTSAFNLLYKINA
ncbi:hypothetical protein O3M35_011572 [Rhynocoris fuscipes]|uniref:DNA-directed RNA polymerase I subunit RPA1 n=1 Tax=Rhynocoris fuscipes TaxID=488301 RepID=A0AAW1CZB5_9HEMI